MRYKYAMLIIVLMLFTQISFSQYLERGFDKKEFAELLRINAIYSESKQNKALIPYPESSKQVYVSPIIGLDNKWELWIKDDRIAIIGIRGSVKTSDSWFVNLFAVQVPAIGELKIAENFIYKYKVAENAKASVHAGYMFSSAFLMQDIYPKIDSLYKKGIKDVIITGHSQGGGLAYLIGANLLWKKHDGELPNDIRIKIYTSASPKPGNLYFAYDYERVTADGWSYSIVNSEDWVPNTPFTVQTVSDLPSVNPLLFIQENIKEQSLIKRLFFRSLYKKISKPPFKVVNTYQKYLGDYIGDKIKEKYNGFEIPKFASSYEYVRTGAQVVLYPDSNYQKKYSVEQSVKNFMIHHSINSYYDLLLQKTVN